VVSLNLCSLAETDDLYRPDYTQNIYRVLPTALRCMGVALPRDDLFGNQKTLRHLKANDATNAHRVIVCIVDSVGIQNFQGTKLAGFFDELGGVSLSSTFPSITSAAISSIYMGLPPTAHGILGHVIYFKEYGALIDTLRMSGATTHFRDAITQAGIDVRALLWEKGISELIKGTHPDLVYAQGLPREIPGTGLGRFYILREDVISYYGFIDGFGMVNRVLEEYPSTPLLCTVYFPLIDTLAHKYGINSPQYRAGCNAFFHHLREFIEGIPSSEAKKTTIVFCSDHGQNSYNEDRAIVITQEEFNEVRDTIKVPPGHSGRVAHFYCKTSQKRRKLKKWLQTRSEDRGIILDPKELDQSGLLPTPINRGVIQRLGDLLLIGRSGVSLRIDRENFTFDSSELLPRADLKGNHGSTTIEELETPFLAFNAKNIQ